MNTTEVTFEMNSEAKINATFQQVDEIKEIMNENIQKAIQRDVKLSALEQSAENLENQANEFKTTTKRVHKRALFQNRKWTFISIAIVLVIIATIAIIIGLAVGLTKKKG
jgi:hypothetical protein